MPTTEAPQGTGEISVASVLAGCDVSAGFQERIYDERFRHPDYDNRSKVHVLSAEWEALCGAVVRADRCLPPGRLTLLDFGYGTGRVTNDLVLTYPLVRAGHQMERDLLVVAYDVSAVGLLKAAETLQDAGFFDVAADVGVLRELSRTQDGCTVTVRFVHGDETAEGKRVGDRLRLVLDPGGDSRYAATVSWYSALGHVQGEDARTQMVEMLGEVTHPLGELVLSVSALGDLVEAQRDWAERIERGTAAESAPAGVKIEDPGDVVYETELGQANFYHVFGPELAGLMGHATAGGEWGRIRIQGIRAPDEEFESLAEEQDNYRRVRWLNQECRDRGWRRADFEALHTVAAVRHFADVAPGDPDARLLGITPE